MINGNAKQGLIDYTTIIALPDPLSSRGKKCFIPNGFQHEDTELPMSRQSQPNLESWDLKKLLDILLIIKTHNRLFEYFSIRHNH